MFAGQAHGRRAPFFRNNLIWKEPKTDQDPGSGKTTLAKALESRLRAIRFAPDEWVDAFSLNLYDE
jgi:hypothetical protein